MLDFEGMQKNRIGEIKVKKSRFSLKKRTFNSIMPLLAVAVILAGFCMAPMKVYAIDFATSKGDTAYIGAKKYGSAAAMDYIKECNTKHPGAIPASDIEAILDAGYLTDYVDELKSLGYISAGYMLSGTPEAESSSQPPAETVSEPAPFTVEDMENTPMWATQVVNYRDGASTEYNKIGSLEQYEQVIVNGVASTGWYRFITSDGSTAYASNSYLTTEAPGNQELNVYNEETGQVDANVSEDTELKVVDELIVPKEEYEEKETAVAEPVPEPEPEEVIAAEEEPEIEEEAIVEEEPSAHSWKFYVSCVFAVLCVIIIGIGIYNIVRNKKNGRN